MRSRSVIAGYVIAIVLAVVFSFLYVRAFEVRGPLWTAGEQMHVSSVTTAETTAADLCGQLQDFAQRHGVDVVRFVPDADRPDTIRHLFVADGGGEASRWLRDGYGDADPEITTTVAPITDLHDTDPRGYYLIGGSSSDALAVLSLVQAAGWTGEVTPYPNAGDLDSYLAFGDLSRAFGVSVLAVIVLIGAGTVLRGRAHGIQRMSGRSSAGILLHELAALLRPVLIFAAGTVAVLATTMYLYNGFAHAAALLTLACRLISVLLVAGLGAHVVGIVITAGRDVLDQVKGEIDGVWALVGAYAVRLPAVFVLLSIIAALGQSVYLAQIEGQTRAYWAQAGDAVTLTVSGNLTDTELNVARSTVAELARKRDSDHGVVLAQRDALAPALTDALVVNQEYLQQVPVLDTNGDRLTTVLSDAITVLVPDDAAAAQVVAAHAAAADWYQFEHSLTLSDIPDPATVPINDARTQAGQNLFTFRTGTGNVMNGPAIAANPVIVVLPSLQFIPQSELFAAVTNGSIVFTDPDTLRADVRAMDLNPAVSAIQPVAYQANESYRQALGAVTINIAGLVAAIVVVALTALIVGVVTVEKNRQRLFVQHLSGWSFAATHRTTFILEAGLILAVTAISLAAAWTRDPLTVQSVIDTGTVDTESYLINQSLIALATAGAAAALLVASLALAHARMLRSHSADA